jgi:excisionase family DNA binding protein
MIPFKGKDRVLTTDEAIEYLRISKPTFLKYLHEGRIRAIKAGNGWRILHSELLRFLKGQTVETERVKRVDTTEREFHDQEKD